ncbi:MAG: VWA domain-containing protein [Acidimicrobiia bacterium]|nr:VWA domain-containing protein [Acidimicrobiia bacterium]
MVPPMRRGALLLALLIGTTILPALSTPLASAAEVPGATAQGCDVRHVLLLLDQSGSLRQTDPGGERVSASQQLIDLLATSAPREGAVSAAIAGFDGRYQPYGRYDLPSGAGAARGELEAFHQRNGGQNTDYVVALRGAASHFASIAAPKECKTLVWFTDGAHDVATIDAGDSPAYSTTTDPWSVTHELSQLVCGPPPPSAVNPRPLAEELRNAGFDARLSELRTGSPNSRTVQLRTNADPVLQALFTPGGPCSISGQRDVLSSADQLADSFFRQFQETSGAVEVDCNRLMDGTLPVAAIAGVAFRLPPGATATVPLAPPHPPLQVAGPTTDTELPAEVRDAGGRLVVQPSAPLRACFVDLDAAAQVLEGPQLYRGSTTHTVDLVVARPEEPTSGGLGPEDVDLVATASGAPVPTSWDGDRHVWVASIPGGDRSSVDLMATATFRGAITGDPALGTVSRSLAVADLPPQPSAAWRGPRSIEGTGRHVGELVFTARATIPGARFCVVLGDGPAAVLDENGAPIGSLRADAPRDACAPFDAGTEVLVPATLELTDQRNGAASFSTGYSATFDDGQEARDLGTSALEVDDLALARSPDRAKATLAALGLAAISVLVPLGVLWLLTWRQSRLPSPEEFLAVSVPARVRRDGPTSATLDGEVAMEDLRPLKGDRTQFHLPGGGSLKRRLPRHPFATPTARISYPGADCATSLPATHSRRARSGVITSHFTQLAVVIVRDDTSGEEEPAEAVLLAPRRFTAAQAAQVLEDGLRAAAARLADNGRPRPAQQGSNAPPTHGDQGTDSSPSATGAAPRPADAASRPASPPAPPRPADVPLRPSPSDRPDERPATVPAARTSAAQASAPPPRPSWF